MWKIPKNWSQEGRKKKLGIQRMASANILFIVSVSWSVETPIHYRLPSNRASDDDDDDDDPKMFFKSAKTRVFCNWWIIFSCYLIKKIIDKISMGELCS